MAGNVDWVEKARCSAFIAKGYMVDDRLLHEFGLAVVHQCCDILLEMHENVHGNHNFYKHAAVEILRKLQAGTVSDQGD